MKRAERGFQGVARFEKRGSHYHHEADGILSCSSLFDGFNLPHNI